MDESTFHTNSENIKVLVKNTRMTYYIRWDSKAYI